MGLLPREATFAEEVADFFLAFRGAGVSLSPLDADLLLDWQARAVPYAVICRGIRRAAEKRAHTLRPGEPALRSLRSCARLVEEELARHQGVATGRAKKVAAKPGPDRLAKARAALAKAAREGASPVRRAAERVHAKAVAASAGPAEVAFRVARLDEAFGFSYLRALPFAERFSVMRAVRERVGGALRAMSPRARRAALRAHRVMAARVHGGLPPLR